MIIIIIINYICINKNNNFNCQINPRNNRYNNYNGLIYNNKI